VAECVRSGPNNIRDVTEGILKTCNIVERVKKMKLRTIAIILLTLTLAIGSGTAFAKTKHHHHKAVAASHKGTHAAKLHHKSKHAAALTAPAPAEPAAEMPQQAQ